MGAIRNHECMPRKSRGRPKPWITVTRTVDPIVAELRAARLEQGITQADLAEAIGICEATLACGERGVSQTSLGNLRAWAQALGYRLKLEKEI